MFISEVFEFYVIRNLYSVKSIKLQKFVSWTKIKCT